MIYTVTLNPAIDYVVGLDAFVPGAVNRCNRENIEFGGKGINVSRVLHSLGIETTALGFIAGFTGQALEQGLQEMGLRTRFIPVSEGMTDTYGKLMDCLPPQVRTVVDATGEALRCALSRKPYLVKPNLPELEDFFGIPMDTKEKVEFAARKMQEMGAKNVLVSMAAQGAMLLDEYGCTHWAKAPKGEVVNSVGAGDSMVAGFLASVSRGQDAASALRMGIAAGSATAFQTGLADNERIMELFIKSNPI